uniref:Uncharacterized protein n=1 Tax=viral metagenome TaxID=1070528 RepID=A0A6H1ZGP4_9ZZZZ
MRQLTAKQKKLINKYMDAHPEARHVDSLDIETWETLEDINDTEILYQEVNRYMGDRFYDVLNK